MITARPLTWFLHWMLCDKNMACLSLLRQEFNMLCLFHSLFNDAKILVKEYTVKIKVLLVTIMKTWVSGGIPPRILNLGTRCRWVVGLVFRQLYLQEITPGAHSRGRWMGRVETESGGTRRRTGGEVKGKEANGVGSQQSSAWLALQESQYSTELTPLPI